MTMLRCSHDWGFPRRWPVFEGAHDVDVETCVKCGARRIALVQFGPAPKESEQDASPDGQLVVA